MRYLIVFLMLVLIFIVIKFFYPPKAIEYPVEAKSASVLSEADRLKMRYRVDTVYRFLGTDLYRERGQFTYKAADLHINLFGKKSKMGSIETREGIRKPVPEELVKGYELAPVFGFWEEYGRWFLLTLLLLCIFLFIKLSNRSKNPKSI